MGLQYGDEPQCVQIFKQGTLKKSLKKTDLGEFLQISFFL